MVFARQVDIVAVAQGKIIPSGYSVKPSNSFETGVIAIHVQDAQAVKQGDVLIELDATQNSTIADWLPANISRRLAEAAACML
ncbi:MAG: HlyD family secretion protein [Nitrospira sp.]|nr:HlyD family secretion protein [Nitrospira sp.]